MNSSKKSDFNNPEERKIDFKITKKVIPRQRFINHNKPELEQN